MENQNSEYKGSFWISNKSIDILLENKATAEQIFAYLVLARFSVELSNVENKYSPIDPKEKFFPIYSSAGETSLKKYLGISSPKAKRILDSLVNMQSEGVRLVFNRDEWRNIAKDFRCHLHLFGLPDDKKDLYKDTPAMISNNGNHPILYALNTFGEKRFNAAWFPNELISGIREKSRNGVLKNPINSVIRTQKYNDIAARLLLMVYRYYDHEYGGADPFLLLRLKYNIDEHSNIGLIRIVKTDGYEIIYNENNILKVLGSLDFVKSKIEEIIKHPNISSLFYWKVLCIDNKSINLGIEVVTDKFKNPYFDQRKVIYELELKRDKVSYRPVENKFLAKEFEKALRHRGFSVADTYRDIFRFNNKYPVFVRDGEEVIVLGVLCPRIPLSHAGVCDGARLYELRKSRFEEGLSRIADLNVQPPLKNIENDPVPDI